MGALDGAVLIRAVALSFHANTVSRPTLAASRCCEVVGFLAAGEPVAGRLPHRSPPGRPSGTFVTTCRIPLDFGGEVRHPALRLGWRGLRRRGGRIHRGPILLE